MTTMTQLRYSPLSSHYRHFTATPRPTTLNIKFADNTLQGIRPVSCEFRRLDYHSAPKLHIAHVGPSDGTIGIGGGRNSGGSGSGGSGGGGDSGGWSGGEDSDEFKSPWDGFGPIGAFISGWRSRVKADPQFPFKVFMEELVGVSACVLGDMASRPNFGLNELDFVFSTLVVGSILNFVLMYLLAPTMASSAHNLPSIFANCPTSHMFEPGSFSLMSRLGTFVYKGAQFAAVGFAAGLVGTALSNGLIKIRKKMDPDFETPNKPPPTILNALTWATHMGLSSNFRYQTLNGVEFLLNKGLPPFIFKSSVVVLRCLNNVLGGMSFVVLARLTGSQNANAEQGLVEEKEKLVKEVDRVRTSETFK